MKGMVFFFLIIIFFFGCAQENEKTISPSIQKNTACFENGKCVSLEIADDPEERRSGLMFRRSLPENSGMLFVFEKAEKLGFWMKNTLIPLDIIWLDKDGIIVSVAEDVKPCAADPCPIVQAELNALYVIEVNSGFVQKNSVITGQRVELNFERE